MKNLLAALLLFAPSIVSAAFTTDWLRNTSSSFTVNGTTYNWQAGSGSSGQALTTNGAAKPTVTWTTIEGMTPGNTNYIQNLDPDTATIQESSFTIRRGKITGLDSVLPAFEIGGPYGAAGPTVGPMWFYNTSPESTSNVLRMPFFLKRGASDSNYAEIRVQSTDTDLAQSDGSLIFNVIDDGSRDDFLALRGIESRVDLLKALQVSGSSTTFLYGFISSTGVFSGNVTAGSMTVSGSMLGPIATITQNHNSGDGLLIATQGESVNALRIGMDGGGSNIFQVRATSVAVGADIRPFNDNLNDLGSISARFNDLYLGGISSSTNLTVTSVSSGVVQSISGVFSNSRVSMSSGTAGSLNINRLDPGTSQGNRVLFATDSSTAVATSGLFKYFGSSVVVTQTGSGPVIVARGNGNGATDTRGEIMLENTSGTPRVFMSNNDGLGGTAGIFGAVGTWNGTDANTRIAEFGFFETQTYATQIAGWTADANKDGNLTGMHGVTHNGSSTRFNVWLDGNGGTALGSYADYNQQRPPSEGLLVQSAGIGDGFDSTRVPISGVPLNVRYNDTNSPPNTGMQTALALEVSNGFETEEPLDPGQGVAIGFSGGDTQDHTNSYMFSKIASSFTTTTSGDEDSEMIFYNSFGGSLNEGARLDNGRNLRVSSNVYVGSTTGGSTLARSDLSNQQLLMTKGDLYVHGGSTVARKGVGSDGAVLISSAAAFGGVHWGTNTGYVLTLGGTTSSSPADASTVHWGNASATILGMTTVEGRNKVYIPKSGTIKSAYFFFFQSTTLGSSETSTTTIRVNGATDNIVNNTTVFNDTFTATNNGSLSIPVAAGDYFEIKHVCATWGTNPAGIRASGWIYIE